MSPSFNNFITARSCICHRKDTNIWLCNVGKHHNLQGLQIMGALFGCEAMCLQHSISESDKSVQAELSWFNKDELSQCLLNKLLHCYRHWTICLDWNKWIHNITKTTLCYYFSVCHGNMPQFLMNPCIALRLGIMVLIHMGPLINTSHFVLLCFWGSFLSVYAYGNKAVTTVAECSNRFALQECADLSEQSCMYLWPLTFVNPVNYAEAAVTTLETMAYK